MRRFLTRTAVGLVVAGGAFCMTAGTANPAGAYTVTLKDALISSVTITVLEPNNASGGTTVLGVEVGGDPTAGNASATATVAVNIVH